MILGSNPSDIFRPHNGLYVVDFTFPRLAQDREEYLATM